MNQLRGVDNSDYIHVPLNVFLSKKNKPLIGTTSGENRVTADFPKPVDWSILEPYLARTPVANQFR